MREGLTSRSWLIPEHVKGNDWAYVKLYDTRRRVPSFNRQRRDRQGNLDTTGSFRTGDIYIATQRHLPDNSICFIQ